MTLAQLALELLDQYEQEARFACAMMPEDWPGEKKAYIRDLEDEVQEYRQQIETLTRQENP